MPQNLPGAFLKMSFFGLRCLGLGPVLTSGLRLPEPAGEAVQEGEEGASLFLSSLLAVSELPDPELTPLKLKGQR
jgi:hypothetical protein